MNNNDQTSAVKALPPFEVAMALVQQALLKLHPTDGSLPPFEHCPDAALLNEIEKLILEFQDHGETGDLTGKMNYMIERVEQSWRRYFATNQQAMISEAQSLLKQMEQTQDEMKINEDSSASPEWFKLISALSAEIPLAEEPLRRMGRIDLKEASEISADRRFAKKSAFGILCCAIAAKKRWLN